MKLSSRTRVPCSFGSVRQSHRRRQPGTATAAAAGASERTGGSRDPRVLQRTRLGKLRSKRPHRIGRVALRTPRLKCRSAGSCIADEHVQRDRRAAPGRG